MEIEYGIVKTYHSGRVWCDTSYELPDVAIMLDEPGIGSGMVTKRFVGERG